jgi:N-acetylneuraminic acid mutarotase
MMGTSKALWQYDPASDTWTKKADYPFETFGAVGFSVNGKGYIGLSGTGFWKYDPNSDAWSKASDFKGGSRTGAKAFVIRDTAYVGLGTSSYTVYPQDIWTFSNN